MQQNQIIKTDKEDNPIKKVPEIVTFLTLP